MNNAPNEVEIDSGCGWPWAAIPPQEEPAKKPEEKSFCQSVGCPWLDEDGNACNSPNDHTTKKDGSFECDFDRGIFPPGS